MSLDNIDKLIEDGTIVACYIRDLNALSITEDKNIYGNYRFSCESIDSPNGYNDCVTILYKIDDENYVEYFSKKEITVIDDNLNTSKTFSDSMKIYKTRYKNHPIVINKKDLRKLGPNEKEKFKITRRFDNIANIIENEFNLVKKRLTQQFKELPLLNKRKKYVNSIYDEIKKLRIQAFLVNLTMLRGIAIDSESYEGEFRHNFVDKRRDYQSKTNLDILFRMGVHTILIKNSEDSYTEYYTKKQIVSKEYLDKYLANPSNADNFCKSYCHHALNHPVVAPANLIEFDENTKSFLEQNYKSDDYIKEVIDHIFKTAINYLHEEYNHTKEVDKEDAYVDNILYDLAMTLEKKKTTD